MHQRSLRLLRRAVFFAVFVLLPKTAVASPDSPQAGFEAGLRVGVELPAGDIDSGSTLRGASLSGVAPYRLPILLDLGYRLSPRWWIGLGAQVGSGPFGDSCPDAAKCEWTDVRIHAQAHYQFRPKRALQPWLGLALGWESLRGSITQKVEVPVDDSTREVALKLRELRGGPQLALQGGLQFAVHEGLRIGPYASAAAGIYLTDSFECPQGLCEGAGVAEDRFHAWFGLGLRGSYGP